jgi:hypothetical protein
MHLRSARRVTIREISSKELHENRRELREAAGYAKTHPLRLLGKWFSCSPFHAVIFGSCGKREEADSAGSQLRLRL